MLNCVSNWPTGDCNKERKSRFLLIISIRFAVLFTRAAKEFGGKESSGPC